MGEFVYRFSRFFVMAYYKLFFPHKVVGKKNVKENEGFVLVCNHFGAIDAAVVSEFFWKKPYFLAKKELMKNKFITKVFRSYGMIPVDRSKADFAAMKECFSVLKRGDNLVIFPEGTRNKNGEELQQVKGGASMIAFKAGVKVIPAAMYKHFRIFRRNYAYIGEPFDFSEFAGQKLNSELIEKLDEKVALKIEECRLKAKELAERKKSKKHN